MEALIVKGETGTGTGGKNAKSSSLKLLDASFTDVGYARYLLQEEKQNFSPEQINCNELEQGISLLHCLVYSDLHLAVQLFVQQKADINIQNKVIKF
jgi:hypothetical protein